MRTYAEINLNSIENNLKEIKKIIGNKKKILLPVKADAYGHGIIEISKFVSNNKLVNMLGVASVDEALNLRENKIELPILLLGLVIPDEKTLKDAINNDIILTIADIETAKKISNISLELNKTTKIHLKIDTGMGRIGCDPSETLKIAQSLIFLKNITLDGIYTHLPIANRYFTENQIKQFENIITKLNLNGIKPRYIHILNSAGILNYDSKLSNMVRPGIISYGYSTNNNSTLKNFKPAMTLKSKIIFTKKVNKGTSLSYGHTYTTKKESNIATISIGYGDGYSRQLSNIGKVLIDNKQYPVVGRVSMDQILVDLQDDEFEIGKDVILFTDKEITASTIALWTNTIPYEITCNISKRVPRIFIQNKTNETKEKQISEKKPKKGNKKMQKLEIFKEEETEPEIIDKIILFDADTLDNAGEIIVDGDNWEYINVDNDHMKDVTKNMKIRAVMSNLMIFNYVFDIITKPYIKK